MLHLLDVVIIVVYLLGTIAIGLLFGGRQKDTGDYFTAEGQLTRLFDSILVGLSIAATFFSGISFLAYPSVVYQGELGILVGLVSFPIAWAILRFWFLPRYLSSGAKQPYDQIEERFGYPVRATAAGMFILLRVGWMGTLIYAPTVALMAAGRLGPGWFWPIVLIVGLSCTFYATVGGIRGVIATDAIQFLVIIVGILLTIGYVLLHLPAPLGQVWSNLGAAGRLKWFNPSFDLRQPMTLWAVLIGFTTANLAVYMADQMSLQRYLAAGTVRSARRAFEVNLIGVVIVIVMLAVVGLALSAWYAAVHDPALPTAPDNVFPYFIASQLPTGVVGLILAAILAATMSSMTSGINALAGTLTLDFRERLRPGTSSRDQMRFARAATLVLGIIATLMAGLVGHLGSIFDIAQILLGVFLGPLLACIVLSVSSLRVRGGAVIAGMVLGCVSGWVVAWSPAASLWVAPAAFAMAMAVPLCEMVFGRARRPAASLSAQGGGGPV
jgi:sodium-coupled monocarboxylate transporter 8/12